MKAAQSVTPADRTGPKPASRVPGVSAYAPPRSAISESNDRLMRLDANEGCPTRDEMLQEFSALHAEVLRRYPSSIVLEAGIAGTFAVDASQVIVTAGADDALDRICRATLEPGRRAIVMQPTFEMIPRYVRLAGGVCDSVSWLDRTFPVDEVLSEIRSDTAAIFIDTPNNPTGQVADVDALMDIATSAPNSIVVADLAYVECADDDPTEALLTQPNVVMIRTFSKAWGLAGLRVGYAVGAPDVVDWLRRVGQPFAVSGASLACAMAAVQSGAGVVREAVARLRSERERLIAQLRSFNIETTESQANFVFAKCTDAWAVADALGAVGICVRRFDSTGSLADRLRITCPGDAEQFDRLRSALDEILNRERAAL